jgi:hypothetical protein
VKKSGTRLDRNQEGTDFFMLEKKTENEGESGSARILTPEREQVELREF